MRHRVILFFICGFAIVTSPCHALSIMRPSTYSKPSADGRFLFVMISRQSLEAEMRYWPEKKAAEIQAIRQRYPQSGLYRNDGSSTPLWIVDWFARDHDVAVVSDGIHLVRHGASGFGADQDALSFFTNGQLIRRYSIGDLVDLRIMLEYLSTYRRWSAVFRLDDASLRCLVSTNDGNSFVFDVTNGSIIESTRYGRVIKWTALIAIVVAMSALLARTIRRRWRRAAYDVRA